MRQTLALISYWQKPTRKSPDAVQLVKAAFLVSGRFLVIARDCCTELEMDTEETRLRAGGLGRRNSSDEAEDWVLVCRTAQRSEARKYCPERSWCLFFGKWRWSCYGQACERAACPWRARVWRENPYDGILDTVLVQTSSFLGSRAKSIGFVLTAEGNGRRCCAVKYVSYCNR
ncbi:uncharacterized protein LY89DRAFT_11368 [Mollisia scopiformis]|uniref:Uncharacterized protein n=1 Tax=Mollisia scopiformis TaxID=149040 RepID=A0A194XWH3_MOLSC|nr:uncharacterized protein LY89DRAFT_11368 [Mollisia scopiformis]KUJ24077.1 hypothetical protein LY89DRAFT_11368 [Mollisia scopiformis]